MNYIKSLNKYPYFLQSSQLPIVIQNKNDKSLRKINEYFNVKEHFKGITDLEKVLSLMEYVHDELFFVGNNVCPEEMNTFEIMKLKKTGSLFCSCYSTVFLEMLLSVGVKATKISCIPAKFDGDCHVAVMVFLDDINKWGFFDPTFNTYFYNKNNLPIDIFEIRNLYKSNSSICFRNITIDKKWDLFINGVEYPTYDQWYQSYMEKNSFRFLLPQKSEYNYTSSYDAKYYFINPLNYSTKNEYDKIANEENIVYLNENIFVS